MAKADPTHPWAITRWLGVQSDDSLPLRGELETSASAVPGQHGVTVGADPRLNLPQGGRCGVGYCYRELAPEDCRCVDKRR